MIFSYFTEFQPKDRRGKMISALATFWMFGNIIAAGKNTEYYVPLTYSVFTMARAVHICSAIFKSLLCTTKTYYKYVIFFNIDSSKC